MSTTNAATNTNWLASLTDPGIKADLSTLAANGALSDSAAIQILQDVASRGAVTAAEFSDLQTIAAHLNAGLTTSDYIAGIFTQLVDGNPANVSWNGGSATATPLGNLEVGSTATQMNELIGKWFLGTDLPDPSLQAGTTGWQLSGYSQFNAPLFGSAGPAVSDVVQGAAGDCELCSSLIEMVDNHPGLLQSMIVNNGNGTYGVRFYVNGNEMWETVNGALPATPSGSLVYNQDTSALWVDLVEKAYAQLSETGLIGHPAVNSYTNIAADPIVDVLANLTDCNNIIRYSTQDPNWNNFKNIFIAAIANHDDVVLETDATGGVYTYDSAGNIQLLPSHAFAVVGYDSKTGNFIVDNPWGTLAGQNWDEQFEVSMATIAATSEDIAVDNSAPATIQASAYAMSVFGGATMSVAPLFSVFNPAGLAVTEYAIQTIGTSPLQLNGAVNLATAAQTAQGQVVVSAADLAKLTVTVSAYGTADSLLVSALVGGSWSSPAYVGLNVNESDASQNTSALLTPNADVVAAGGRIAVSSLFKTSGTLDPNNAWYQIYNISNLGTINLNGATNVSAYGGVAVSAADLQLLTFTAPAQDGSVTLQVAVYNGSAWTHYQNVLINVGTSSVAGAMQNDANGQLAAAANVADTAANVFAGLDGLQTMLTAGALQTVSLTDSTTQNETITGTQFDNDKGVLNLLSGQYALTVSGMSAADAVNMTSNVSSHIATVSIADSAANVAANLDGLEALAAAKQLTSIRLTDSGSPLINLSLSQFTNDAGALQDITGAYRLAVTGAAASVSADLDALQTYAATGKLATIALTDSGTPTLAVTLAQLNNDAGALAALTGSYDLAVSGTVTAAAAASVAAVSHVTSIAVTDSAADVTANLSALQTLAVAGKLSSITLTDSGTPNFTLTPSQLGADAIVLHDITGNDTVSVPGVDSGIVQFIVGQNVSGRLGGGLDFDYPLAAGNSAPVGANLVSGFQSVNFTHGYDAVVLDNPRADYAVQVDGAGNIVIKDIGTGDATYGQSISVTGASYIVFGGGATDSSGDYPNMYFIANSQNAAIAELYVAALGRLPDLPGLEFWQNQLAAGYSMESIANDFLTSPEFNARFPAAAAPSDDGGPNDQAFITALYENVLHRAPDIGGFDFWVAGLASGVSRADVLINFAVSAEDVANTNATPGFGSGWLIDTSNGGYADSSALLSVTTVLSQGINNAYLNTALINPATVGSGVTLGQETVTTGTLTFAAGAVAETILLSSNFSNIVVNNSHDMIYDNGNDTITVNGSGNVVSLSSSTGHDSINLLGGSANVVQYFTPGSGTTLHLVNTTAAANITLLDGSTTPVAGATLNFGGSAVYVIDVGAIGNGTAAEAAAAINKAYTVADKPGETITFIGEDSSGNTEAWFFGSTAGVVNGVIPAAANAASADHNGNHLVDAGEIVQIATLVGVVASHLTVGDLI